VLPVPLWSGTAHVVKLGPVGIAGSFDQFVPFGDHRREALANRQLMRARHDLPHQ
jgi:hypothetical protein